MRHISWKDEPAEHDDPAAAPYPALLAEPETVASVRAGRAMSPVLLVRGDLARGIPLQVTDGYQRTCASYHPDADAHIPCRIVGLPLAR